MKRVIDLTSLADNFSGIERYALNISLELLKNDNNNEYILLFKNEIHDEFNKFKDNKNISMKIIKGKGKLYFGQIKLVKHLYSIDADQYIFLAFPSPILFKKKGIINTIHDLTPWDYPQTMKLLSNIYFKISIKNAIRVSKQILTVSNYSKHRICDQFKFRNIEVIYNGISDVFKRCSKHERLEVSSKVREKYKLPNEYLMCLCTLEPRKNINLLIDSYIELRNEQKIKEKLVLVGRNGWKIDNLLNEIDSKYSEDIIITGFVDDEDLPYIYSRAKAFIFPSLYEGFGIPVIEAMYMDVLVICSNTSSLPEVVGNNGILFENNNKEDLKQKIVGINNFNEHEIKMIRKKSKERASYFEWKKESKKLIKLLNEI